MARKPNYRFERSERERIKAEKKAARAEAKSRRANPDGAETDPPEETDASAGDPGAVGSGEGS